MGQPARVQSSASTLTCSSQHNQAITTTMGNHALPIPFKGTERLFYSSAHVNPKQSTRLSSQDLLPHLCRSPKQTPKKACEDTPGCCSGCTQFSQEVSQVVGTLHPKPNKCAKQIPGEVMIVDAKRAHAGMCTLDILTSTVTAQTINPDGHSVQYVL